MIIVYDSVKHRGISPRVITIVAFARQLFSLLWLIFLMSLFSHYIISLGLISLRYQDVRDRCSGVNLGVG